MSHALIATAIGSVFFVDLAKSNEIIAANKNVLQMKEKIVPLF
jgi:hypothetical protein